MWQFSIIQRTNTESLGKCTQIPLSCTLAKKYQMNKIGSLHILDPLLWAYTYEDQPPPSHYTNTQ